MRGVGDDQLLGHINNRIVRLGEDDLDRPYRIKCRVCGWLQCYRVGLLSLEFLDMVSIVQSNAEDTADRELCKGGED